MRLAEVDVPFLVLSSIGELPGLCIDGILTLAAAGSASRW